ncbi:MAG: polysaccharide deacetylase family protein [Imperialibacter sp.]|uniref:polysaccharide deacetylase family protein n=1 Tax=Imperialibacter sp. TaxID=2038411 RepID=UPI003A8AC6F8
MPEIPESNKNRLKRAVLWIVIILLLWLVFGCSGKKSEKKEQDPCASFECQHGAVVRADTAEKSLTLVFTGDEFADGAAHIIGVLTRQQVKAAFFFTGNFYGNPAFEKITHQLKQNGHYLGAHSDKHLLYCSWENRDSLLVTKREFTQDLEANYLKMERFGIRKSDSPYFLPPYEWYNDSISTWTRDFGLQLINFTSGTRSNSDYTTPDMPNYRSSEVIYNSILEYEQKDPAGLNGFLLLVHIGTAPKRTDKFYLRLEELIVELRAKEYEFKSLVDLLNAGTSGVKEE